MRKTFVLTLTNNAGFLEIVADSRAQVEASVAPVSGSISDIKEEPSQRTSGPDLCLELPSDNLRVAPVIEALHRERKLGWLADSVAEAQTWRDEYTARGARIVKIQPVIGTPLQSVVIGVSPANANEVLGFEVDPIDWLDEDLAELTQASASQ